VGMPPWPAVPPVSSPVAPPVVGVPPTPLPPAAPPAALPFPPRPSAPPAPPVPPSSVSPEHAANSPARPSASRPARTPVEPRCDTGRADRIELSRLEGSSEDILPALTGTVPAAGWDLGRACELTPECRILAAWGALGETTYDDGSPDRPVRGARPPR